MRTYHTTRAAIAAAQRLSRETGDEYCAIMYHAARQPAPPLADNTYLDWETALYAQSEEAKAALAKLEKDPIWPDSEAFDWRYTASGLYEALTVDLGFTPTQAFQKFAAAGISGIRWLDGTRYAYLSLEEN